MAVRLAAAALWLMPSAVRAGTPAEMHDFRIAGGALDAAIQEFSRQADIQIATSLNMAGRTGKPVEGHMSSEKALAQLLQGQPIQADYMGGGYVLRPETSPAPPKPDAEAVTVTGFRGELRRALAIKRAAVGSQDSVLAEDIAAFPDRNLAEALQRIPGVTITRDSGEGRQISLRGLGPDFTRTQIDGMEVLSNTASGMDNRGLVSRTRSFDYSVFAAEMFKQVDVEKSWTASQDEGGIGGTIGLFTPEPFDYDGFRAMLSAKAATNSNTGTVTPRLTGLISQHWRDFGVLVSASWSTSDSNEYGYRNWGWSQITVAPANIGPGVSAADAARLTSTSPVTQLYAPQAETDSTWYDHRTRLGITTALQYQPSDRLQLGLDLLYGRLTNDRRDYALAAAGTNGLTGDVDGAQMLDSLVIRNNSIIAAQWSHIDMRSEYNVMHDSTDFEQAVLNGTLAMSDTVSLHAMAGYAHSSYKLPVFDKVFLESQDHDFGYDDRPAMPVNSYGFDTSAPAQWNLMRLDTQEDAITDGYLNGKLDLVWQLDATQKVTAGLAVKKFTNDGWMRADKQFHNDPADTAIPAADKETVPFDTLANYVVGDVDRTYATIGQIRALTPAYDIPGSDFAVSERTWAGYVQYGLDAPLSTMRLHADAGLRYFETALSSAGSLNTGTRLVPVDISHHYNDVLPAITMALDITDSLILRLSANRNISRPSLSDLAAAGTLTTAPFGGTISAGNPNLKPFMADSVEGSLEYYQDALGYMALGGFYKNMESFITTQTTVVPYGSTGYPLSFLLPGQSPTVPYNYTTPINGKGAAIVGLEAAFQRDFDFLPAPFDRLGFVGNVTLADGATPVIFSGQAISLPLSNLSKLSANMTLYYQTNRWDWRIAYAYRSKYLNGASGNGNIGDFIAATGNVDLAAHYRIDEHFKLTVEGNDLTDQAITQYSDLYARRPEAVTHSGTTWSIGLSYTY